MKYRGILGALGIVSACGGTVFITGEDERGEEPITYTPCEPGRSRPCYTGPDGTRGEGTCREGAEVCVASGEGYGACEGQVVPRAQDCGTPADETCGESAPSCSGKTSWVFGATSGESGGADVAFTPDGGVVVVGFINGTVQFESAQITTDHQTAFLAKLDIDGRLDWFRTVESSGSSRATSVVVDEAGVITVAGRHSETASLAGAALSGAGGFIARLGRDGDLLWARSYGTSHVAPMHLAASIDGGFVVAGALFGATDLGTGTLSFAGSQDVFVMATTSTGVPQWSLSFGSTAPDRVDDLAVDDAGRILLAGSFDADLNLGNGLPTIDHRGDNDGYVVGLGGDGEVDFVAHLAGSGSDIANAAVASPSGEVVMAGFLTSGAVDTPTGTHLAAGGASLYLGRLAGDGTPLDDMVIGGDSGSIYPRDLAIDSAGQLLLLGMFDGDVDLGGGVQSTGNGSESLFIAKRDPELGHIWSRVFGDAQLQRPTSLDQDPYGGIVITGDFRGGIDFSDNLVLPPSDHPGPHLFVARFEP